MSMAVPSPDPLTYATSKMRPLPHLIFMSPWLPQPLYLGLIVAQLGPAAALLRAEH